MLTVTSRDGTRIAYDIAGDGPLMVCVFGATCFRNFLPVKGDVKTFRQRFRVVNFDRRGRGDSAEHGDWSLEREVEDIAALIDANGGEAIVYGHSSGAVLALEAALRLGSRVSRAIIHDASYVSDEPDAAAFRVVGDDVAALLDAGRPGPAIRRFLTGIGMPRAFAMLLPVMPGWGTMKRLAPTLRYDIALTEAVPDYARFAAIGCPVLVMAGEKNPPSIRSVYDRLLAAVPGATGTILPGQDHMASAKVVLPELVAFAASGPGT